MAAHEHTHEQRQRDLAEVDAEARRLGQHPLDPRTRAFRADLIAAVRVREAAEQTLKELRRRRDARLKVDADHKGAP